MAAVGCIAAGNIGFVMLGCNSSTVVEVAELPYGERILFCCASGIELRKGLILSGSSLSFACCELPGLRVWRLVHSRFELLKRSLVLVLPRFQVTALCFSNATLALVQPIRD